MVAILHSETPNSISCSTRKSNIFQKSHSTIVDTKKHNIEIPSSSTSNKCLSSSSSTSDKIYYLPSKKSSLIQSLPSSLSAIDNISNYQQHYHHSLIKHNINSISTVEDSTSSEDSESTYSSSESNIEDNSSYSKSKEYTNSHEKPIDIQSFKDTLAESAITPPSTTPTTPTTPITPSSKDLDPLDESLSSIKNTLESFKINLKSKSTPISLTNTPSIDSTIPNSYTNKNIESGSTIHHPKINRIQQMNSYSNSININNTNNTNTNIINNKSNNCLNSSTMPSNLINSSYSSTSTGKDNFDSNLKDTTMSLVHSIPNKTLKISKSLQGNRYKLINKEREQKRISPEFKSLCYRLLEELKNHADSGPFLNSLDAEITNEKKEEQSGTQSNDCNKDHDTSLSEKKDHMDLNTIECNLEENKYTNLYEVFNDLQQMLLQCYKNYTKENHVIHRMGKNIEKFLIEKILEMPEYFLDELREKCLYSYQCHRKSLKSSSTYPVLPDFLKAIGLPMLLQNDIEFEEDDLMATDDGSSSRREEQIKECKKKEKEKLCLILGKNNKIKIMRNLKGKSVENNDLSSVLDQPLSSPSNKKSLVLSLSKKRKHDQCDKKDSTSITFDGIRWDIILKKVSHSYRHRLMLGHASKKMKFTNGNDISMTTNPKLLTSIHHKSGKGNRTGSNHSKCKSWNVHFRRNDAYSFHRNHFNDDSKNFIIYIPYEVIRNSPWANIFHHYTSDANAMILEGKKDDKLLMDTNSSSDSPVNGSMDTENIEMKEVKEDEMTDLFKEKIDNTPELEKTDSMMENQERIVIENILLVDNQNSTSTTTGTTSEFQREEMMEKEEMKCLVNCDFLPPTPPSSSPPTSPLNISEEEEEEDDDEEEDGKEKDIKKEESIKIELNHEISQEKEDRMTLEAKEETKEKENSMVVDTKEVSEEKEDHVIVPENKENSMVLDVKKVSKEKENSLLNREKKMVVEEGATARKSLEATKSKEKGKEIEGEKDSLNRKYSAECFNRRNTQLNPLEWMEAKRNTKAFTEAALNSLKKEQESLTTLLIRQQIQNIIDTQMLIDHLNMGNDTAVPPLPSLLYPLNSLNNSMTGLTNYANLNNPALPALTPTIGNDYAMNLPQSNEMACDSINDFIDWDKACEEPTTNSQSTVGTSMVDNSDSSMSLYSGINPGLINNSNPVSDPNSYNYYENGALSSYLNINPSSTSSVDLGSYSLFNGQDNGSNGGSSNTCTSSFDNIKQKNISSNSIPGNNSHSQGSISGEGVNSFVNNTTVTATTSSPVDLTALAANTMDMNSSFVGTAMPSLNNPALALNSIPYSSKLLANAATLSLMNAKDLSMNLNGLSKNTPAVTDLIYNNEFDDPTSLGLSSVPANLRHYSTTALPMQHSRLHSTLGSNSSTPPSVSSNNLFNKYCHHITNNNLYTTASNIATSLTAASTKLATKMNPTKLSSGYNSKSDGKAGGSPNTNSVSKSMTKSSSRSITDATKSKSNTKAKTSLGSSTNELKNGKSSPTKMIINSTSTLLNSSNLPKGLKSKSSPVTGVSTLNNAINPANLFNHTPLNEKKEIRKSPVKTPTELLNEKLKSIPQNENVSTKVSTEGAVNPIIRATSHPIPTIKSETDITLPTPTSDVMLSSSSNETIGVHDNLSSLLPDTTPLESSLTAVSNDTSLTSSTDDFFTPSNYSYYDLFLNLNNNCNESLISEMAIHENLKEEKPELKAKEESKPQEEKEKSGVMENEQNEPVISLFHNVGKEKVTFTQPLESNTAEGGDQKQEGLKSSPVDYSSSPTVAKKEDPMEADTLKEVKKETTKEVLKPKPKRITISFDPSHRREMKKHEEESEEEEEDFMEQDDESEEESQLEEMDEEEEDDDEEEEDEIEEEESEEEDSEEEEESEEEREEEEEVEVDESDSEVEGQTEAQVQIGNESESEIESENEEIDEDEDEEKEKEKEDEDDDEEEEEEEGGENEVDNDEEVEEEEDEDDDEDEVPLALMEKKRIKQQQEQQQQQQQQKEQKEQKRHRHRHHSSQKITITNIKINPPLPKIIVYTRKEEKGTTVDKMDIDQGSRQEFIDVHQIELDEMIENGYDVESLTPEILAKIKKSALSRSQDKKKRVSNTGGGRRAPVGSLLSRKEFRDTQNKKERVVNLSEMVLKENRDRTLSKKIILSPIRKRGRGRSSLKVQNMVELKNSMTSTPAANSKPVTATPESAPTPTRGKGRPKGHCGRPRKRWPTEQQILAEQMKNDLYLANKENKENKFKVEENGNTLYIKPELKEKSNEAIITQVSVMTTNSTEPITVITSTVPSSVITSTRNSHFYSSSPKQCTYCGSTSTPLWRHGPPESPRLCNSCGVKWKRGKILQSQPSGFPWNSISVDKKTEEFRSLMRCITSEKVLKVLGILKTCMTIAMKRQLERGEEVKIDIRNIDSRAWSQLYRYIKCQ